MEDLKIFNDQIKYREETKFSESSNHNRNKKAKFHTEIEFRNEFGELLDIKHNELVLSGGFFTLSKLINQNPPFEHAKLEDELGIEVKDNTEFKLKGVRRASTVCLFGIGIGGCTDVFDTVADVKYKDRKLDMMIPFRKVPKDVDLTVEEKKKYFMKKLDDEYYEYYLKGFEVEPEIKCEFDEVGKPAVPSNVDELDLPEDKIINTYMQIKLKVSNDDVREYFKLEGGGVRKSRVNTLGLYTAYPVEKEDGSIEYKDARLFSKLNFNNEPFVNDTRELNIIYKIYV